MNKTKEIESILLDQIISKTQELDKTKNEIFKRLEITSAALALIKLYETLREKDLI